MAYSPGFLHKNTRLVRVFLYYLCMGVMVMATVYIYQWVHLQNLFKPVKLVLRPSPRVGKLNKELEEFEMPSGGSTADEVESGVGVDTEEEGQDKLMRVRRMVKDH